MAYLREYIGEYQMSPSMREIGTAVGLASAASVREALNQLEDQGLIRMRPGVARSITLVER